ncbi:response regulator transcription factor [Nocardia callitridis]
MTVRTWHELSRKKLLGVMSVLEFCAESRGGEKFKHSLAELIAIHFGVRDVTFFHGVNYPAIFADPAPVLTGATERLLPVYQETWSDKDVFAMPTARRLLTRNGFATLDELARLPTPQRSYVVDYLNPNDINSAAAIHLTLADGEALVGMFDHIRPWDSEDLVAVRLLARQLRVAASTVHAESAPVDDPLTRLSVRQIEVAELVSDGLNNHEIAEALNLSELSIKKYVSRIFEATGYRNRAELAAAVLRRHHIPRRDHRRSGE